MTAEHHLARGRAPAFTRAQSQACARAGDTAPTRQYECPPAPTRKERS